MSQQYISLVCQHARAQGNDFNDLFLSMHPLSSSYQLRPHEPSQADAFPSPLSFGKQANSSPPLKETKSNYREAFIAFSSQHVITIFNVMFSLLLCCAEEWSARYRTSIRRTKASVSDSACVVIRKTFTSKRRKRKKAICFCSRRNAHRQWMECRSLS